MPSKTIQVHVAGTIPETTDAAGLLSLASTFAKAGHDKLATYLRQCADKLAAAKAPPANPERDAFNEGWQLGRAEGIRDAVAAFRQTLHSVETMK